MIRPRGNSAVTLVELLLATVIVGLLLALLLPADDYAAWLDRANEDTAALSALLRPSEDLPFTATPVSTLVNSPKNDVPECVAPAE